MGDARKMMDTKYQIKELRKLKASMIGTLYPLIVQQDINNLSIELAKLEKGDSNGRSIH